MTALPQAHYINNRTMEVFRGMGGLAGAVKDRSPPLALWRKFVYCESLTGPILGSVDHFEVLMAEQKTLPCLQRNVVVSCRVSWQHLSSVSSCAVT